MRLRRVMLVVWCLGTSVAMAQTDTLVGIRKGSIELGGAGGLSIPAGDYGDVTLLSGTGAFIVGYYPSPQFSFGLDMGGHWHKATDAADSALAAELGQTDAELGFKLYRIFTPYAKYQFNVAKVSPYVTGLLGFYLQEMKWTEATQGGTVTQTLAQGYFGMAAGFGVQMVSDDSVLLWLEGRFHNAVRGDSGPIQFIDARVGLAFLL